MGMTPIERLVEGFRADLTALILKHRQMPDRGAVWGFIDNVGRLRARYSLKIQGLRDQGRLVEVEQIETAIETLALETCGRVASAGRVEL